jgi:hypothetical protein
MQSLHPTLPTPRPQPERARARVASIVNLARNLVLSALVAIGTLVAPLAQAAALAGQETHHAQVICVGTEAAGDYLSGCETDWGDTDLAPA